MQRRLRPVANGSGVDISFCQFAASLRCLKVGSKYDCHGSRVTPLLSIVVTIFGIVTLMNTRQFP